MIDSLLPESGACTDGEYEWARGSWMTLRFNLNRAIARLLAVLGLLGCSHALAGTSYPAKIKYYYPNHPLFRSVDAACRVNLSYSGHYRENPSYPGGVYYDCQLYYPWFGNTWWQMAVQARASCPYSGTLLGSNAQNWICVNADPCPSSQTRNASTGQCTEPPRNLGAPPPSGGSCQAVPGGYAGNPIAVAVGNKVESAEELALPGHLEFVRYYGSGHLTDLVSQPFNQWSHTYSRRLLLRALDGQVSVLRANGGVVPFSVVDGAYQGEPGTRDRLIEVVDAANVRQGWDYLSVDEGSVEHYGLAGELLSVDYRDGGRVTLAYNPDLAEGERLESVVDDYGRRLEFAYDARGYLASVTAPDGRKVGYEVDANGNLTTVTYPDDDTDPANNPQLVYHYNEQAYTGGANLPNAMTGVTHPGGIRYSTFRYAADGKAISTEHAQGVGHFDLSYGPDHTSTIVTDYRGTQRTHHFATIAGVVRPTGVSQPGGAGCAAASSEISYDAAGNVASRADFNGNRTCYATDAARNLEIARIEGLDALSACPADVAGTAPAAGQRKITSEWHPLWRIKTRQAEPKKISTWGYNGEPDPTRQGQILNCAPAGAELAAGVPIAVLCKQIEQATTDETGATAFGATADGPPRVVSYTYDALGQVLTLDGPRTDVADVTTYEYWPADATCPGATEGTGMDKGCRGQLHFVTNAASHTVAYTKYDARGSVLSRTDPNGLVHGFAYDARDRLTGHTVNGRTTQYAYDLRGLLTRITQPDASYVEYLYDDAERQIGVRDNLGNAIDYVLDAAGHRTSETVRDVSGTLTRVTSREYDALSRMHREVQGETQ